MIFKDSQWLSCSLMEHGPGEGGFTVQCPVEAVSVICINNDNDDDANNINNKT